MIAGEPKLARYIMIGGFLGAGKTTAVGQLGRHLTQRGLRVGLISNDQSTGLVDTAILRSQGFDVEEIAGGCFCCRFNSLVDAANKLSAQSRPDVFIAEPVGSCTDLVATVSYPLRRIYGSQFSIAPLSVLVDPVRCARILGLTSGRSFSEKVVYVYRKQLEEAKIIVVNKCDTVAQPLRDRLVESLRASYPQSEVLCCSARMGDGLNDWFTKLESAEQEREVPTMALDYEEYAEGEALLGWLNCTVRLTSDALFDGNKFLLSLADELRQELNSDNSEIAHLKMTLDSSNDVGSLSVVSLVGAESEPDLRESLMDKTNSGELIINLRAEADPEKLRSIVEATLDRCVRAHQGVSMMLEHLEHFRPKKPEPTHRVVVSS